MHSLFVSFLKEHQVKSELIEPFKEHFLSTYQMLAANAKEMKVLSQKALKELHSKRDTVEERYACGEIDVNVYSRVAGKIRKEINQRSVQAGEAQIELSNPELLIAQTLQIVGNLAEIWGSGDLNERVKLQELLFPNGVEYCREIDSYRTSSMHPILKIIRSVSANSGNSNDTLKSNMIELSGLVAAVGIVNLLQQVDLQLKTEAKKIKLT